MTLQASLSSTPLTQNLQAYSALQKELGVLNEKNSNKQLVFFCFALAGGIIFGFLAVWLDPTFSNSNTLLTGVLVFAILCNISLNLAFFKKISPLSDMIKLQGSEDTMLSKFFEKEQLEGICTYLESTTSPKQLGLNSKDLNQLSDQLSDQLRQASITPNRQVRKAALERCTQELLSV